LPLFTELPRRVLLGKWASAKFDSRKLRRVEGALVASLIPTLGQYPPKEKLPSRVEQYWRSIFQISPQEICLPEAEALHACPLKSPRELSSPRVEWDLLIEE
jgi:hypothetical protein